MQFHTEFQYDPAQDRRAGRTGQQRLELEARPLVALRAWYFFPSMLVMSISGTITLFWLEAPGQPKSPRSDSKGK